MTTSRPTQVLKEADDKVAAGNFVEAIGLYESTLDGSPGSAEVHYRLALLYDDKMNDPLHALHHFKRYLTIAPDGAHANDVKNFMKRDELTYSDQFVRRHRRVPRAEAARLRNENLGITKANRRQPLSALAQVRQKQKVAGEKNGDKEVRAQPQLRSEVGRHARIHFTQILQDIGALEKNSRCQRR